MPESEDNPPRTTLRPLLAAPAHRQHDPQPTPPPPAVSVPKRTYTKAACENCRSRKIKCDGGRPHCSACVSTSRECHYPADPSETRSAALKRKYGDIQGSLTDHESLYSLLATRQPEECQEIIRQIQAGRDVKSVVRNVQDGSLLLQLASGPSSSSNDGPSTSSTARPRSTEATSRLVKASRRSLPAAPGARPQQHPPRPRVGSKYEDPAYIFEQNWRGPRDAYVENNMFVDLPGYELPLSRWTTVSNDDHLLSHLSLLFWTWDTIANRLIDRGLFEEDLRHAEASTATDSPETRFCSPFLVNAFLAVGCLYTTNQSTFTRPDDLLTRGQAFADEAERLLQQEDRHPSLPVIQGLGLMYIYEGTLGRGARALDFHKRFHRKYLQLPLDTTFAALEANASEARREKLKHGLPWIRWGIYSFDRKMMFAFGRRFALARPNADKPWKDRNSPLFTKEDTSDYWWFAYPLSLTPQKSLKWELFDAECALSEFTSEVLDFLNPLDGEPSPRDNPTKAVALYNKLVAWKFSLPDRLRAENADLPGAVSLHIEVDLILISILRPFHGMSMNEFGPFEPTMTSFTHASNAMSTTWTFRALYTLRLEYWIIQSSAFCAFLVLFDLDSSPIQVETFIKACQALSELGETYTTANDVLYSIQSAAEKQRIRVPSFATAHLPTSVNGTGDSVMRSTVIKVGNHNGTFANRTISDMLEEVTLEGDGPD